MLDNNQLQFIKKHKALITAIIGALSFSLILVTTLNIILATIFFVLFVSLAVFQKSFHRGLIFMMIIILLLPPLYIVDNIFTEYDFLVIILALMGLLNLFLEKYKFRWFNIFFYIILLYLIYISIGVFKGDGYYQFPMMNFNLTIVAYPVLMIAFQYFFQTPKRIERFFIFLVITGCWQGLVILIIQSRTFFFSGVSNLLHYSGDVYQGVNLLTVTIPVTVGMLLLLKDDLLQLNLLKRYRKKLKYLKLQDIFQRKTSNNQYQLNEVGSDKIINLKKENFIKHRILQGLLFWQILAVSSTLSFLHFLTVSIGIFIIGVLFRSKIILHLVGWSVAIIGGLLWYLDVPFLNVFREVILNIIYVFKDSSATQLLWGGFDIHQYLIGYGSYMFLFLNMGLVGLIIFGGLLFSYFKELHSAYLKSDGFKRIWLIVLIAIFMEMLFLAIFYNVYFDWPTVLLFWLFYGLMQNLKKQPMEHRLMETIIS